jgi:hydroxypyruvate isomerase
MPRFSANLGFLWPDRPLLERIAAAAAAGFKAIELHWPYDVPAEQVRDACARHGLVLLGINSWRGDAAKGEFGFGALPGREADCQASVDQAIAYCRDAGGRAIHVMAGVADPSQHSAGFATFVANLREAAAKAGDLRLLLEPLNQRDIPGYFYSTIEEAGEILDRVGAPNLKIMFDVYQVGVSQGDVLTRLGKWIGQIGHVQIAAVPSRAEPDEGEIAYGAIFDALDALGYDGWIGCEYKPRSGTDEGLVWIKRLGLGH